MPALIRWQCVGNIFILLRGKTSTIGGEECPLSLLAAVCFKYAGVRKNKAGYLGRERVPLIKMIMPIIINTTPPIKMGTL